LLALVLEPVAELTNLFLQPAHVQKDDAYPILADLATERFSDVVVILQYLFSMLLGQTPRVNILLNCPGEPCESLRAWVLTNLDGAKTLRRLVRCASAWVHRRHHKVYTSFPWRLAAVGDPRVSAAEAASIVEEFYRSPACCLQVSFCQRLRSAVSRDSMLESFGCWRRVFWRWVAQVRVTVADIECRHARCQ